MNDAINTMSDWLESLGKANNIELSLNELNRCYLETEEQIAVVVYALEHDPHFYINAEICKAPEEERFLMFQSALAQNMFQQDTRGGCIAWDEESDCMVFSMRETYAHKDARDFANIIQNIIEVVTEIKANLGSFDTETIQAELELAPNMLRI